MPSKHGYWLFLTCTTILCGCQVSFEAIPTGRWEGQGTYASYKENAEGALEHTDGTYKTTVVISKRNVAGQDVRLVRILADHSDDSLFGRESVHVVLMLSDSGTHIDGSLLCDTHAKVETRRSAVLAEPGDDELERILGRQPSASVVLLRSGWLNFVHVEYESPGKPGRFPFAENFTFDGDRLIKKGYHGSEAVADEAVHWEEVLRKVE